LKSTYKNEKARDIVLDTLKEFKKLEIMDVFTCILTMNLKNIVSPIYVSKNIFLSFY